MIAEEEVIPWKIALPIPSVQVSEALATKS